MEVRVKSYFWGLYEKSMPESLPLHRKLKEAGRAGFDYLELSVDESDEKLALLNWDDKTVIDLERSRQEAGVPIKSMCLSGHRRFPLGHPQEDIREKSLVIMQKAIALSAKLGN